MRSFFESSINGNKTPKKKKRQRDHPFHLAASERTAKPTSHVAESLRIEASAVVQRDKLPESTQSYDDNLHLVEFVYPRDPRNPSRVVPFRFEKSRKRSRSESDLSLGAYQENISVGTKSDSQGSLHISSETLDNILDNKRNQCVVAGIRSDNVMSHSIPSRKEYPELERKLSGVSVEDAVRDKSGCRPRANSTDGELNLPRRGLCDEGMVLSTHEWSSSWRQKSPKGFVNLGNTCYLNATLQCLAYLPPFCQTLTSLEQPVEGKQSQGQRITHVLRKLFRRVHDLDQKPSIYNGSGSIAPQSIVKAIPTLGTIGSRNGYKFRPGRQEDAHEFLVHLLEAMHDGELRAAGINQQAKGWRGRLPVPRLDETTFIHRIFGGYLRSQVRCSQCSYCSNTYDPFLDLNLEVSKKKANSIASAFQEFTRKETLDANNQWRCSGCKKDVCPTKQLTVFRPPLALCIQLKRFTYGGTFGFGSFAGFSNGMNFVSGIGGGNKITKAIEFPACLRLPLSDGRRCEYKLTGIVVHLGNNATSGHYTSFVRKPGLNGSWYHMDDSFVEPVSEKTVLRQKDAYVLFYCRTEVKLELPSPPLKVSMTTEQAKLVSMTRSQAASRAVATKDSYGLSQIPNESDPKEQGINIFGQEGEATKFATESQTAIESYSAPVTGSTDRQESIKNDVSKSEPENKHQQHVHLSSESIEDDSDKATGRHDVESEPKEEVTEKELAGCGNDTKRSNIPNEASSSSRNREPSNSGGRAESEVDGQKQNTSNLLDFSSLNEINVEGKQPDVSQDKKNTRVMIDHGTAQGKLEVMIGPRYKVKKKWQPKYTYARSSEENLALLGTRMIPKWDDPDNKEEHYAAHKMLARTTVVESLQKAENERKRSMHLDRWDAALDQGRTKKVKIKQHDQPDVLFAAENNPFYRIQSGIQKMNRQRAKGFHHPQNATSRHSSKKKDRRRFSKHKF